MSGAGWVGIACLAVAPFILAEYQRRVWVQEERLKQLVTLNYLLKPFAEALVTAMKSWTMSMAEAAEGFARLAEALRPVGEPEMIPVRLEECWRCLVSIPREDPLGLCQSCQIQLRNF